MRGKILLLTGLAVGYVLGARAGRERYEEIKRFASKAWNDPRVQHQVERVEDFAKDKGPEVADFISDSAKKVVAQVTGSKSSGSKASGAKASRSKSSSAKSTGSKSTAAKSSASKSAGTKSSAAPTSSSGASSGSSASGSSTSGSSTAK